MKKSWLAVLVLLGLFLFLPVHASEQVFTKHTIKDSFNAEQVFGIDLDGDGDVDVLATSRIQHALLWWENGGGAPASFTEHTVADHTPGVPVSLHGADVDGDSDVDVLAGGGGNGVWGSLSWWENVGGTPPNWLEHVIVQSYDAAQSVYSGDLDDDGDVDLVSARYGAGIQWWQNDGYEHFTGHTISGNLGRAQCVRATDVDGDGDLDVLGAALTDDDIIWWENNPSGQPPPLDPISWTRHTIADDFMRVVSVCAADIDNDGDVDVLGAAKDGDEVSWWENDGNETFTAHTIQGSFQDASCVHAADMDGDGDVDVLGGAKYGFKQDRWGTVAWWENSPSGADPPGGPVSWVLRTITNSFFGSGS
ncbi:MAG TPA: FG-GAP-like repeat-containing protein, partial [Anaerolineae bacterium]|nr:FG-GAP-like repeat-containing protein [Anaerolineae bacterium]